MRYILYLFIAAFWLVGCANENKSVKLPPPMEAPGEYSVNTKLKSKTLKPAVNFGNLAMNSEVAEQKRKASSKTEFRVNPSDK